MNWLDFVLALILLASGVAGLRRGLSREIIGLIAGVLALLLGIWFYGTVGFYLLPYVSSRTMANAGGFVVVFCGVLLLGALVSYVVGRFLKVTGLSIVDHLLGSGLRPAAWIGVCNRNHYGSDGVFARREAARSDRPLPDGPLCSGCRPHVRGMAPHELKEGFRRTYAQVKAAWSDALDKGIRKLPNGEMKKDERQI